jgi:hypothetical protein
MIVTRQTAESAAAVLGLDLDDAGFCEPLVQRSYRERAKLLHPDRGGDPRDFVELDRAKCILVEWVNRPVLSTPTFNVNECLQCSGTGRRKVQRGFRQFTIVCSACRGMGERVPPEKVEP